MTQEAERPCGTDYYVSINAQRLTWMLTNWAAGIVGDKLSPQGHALKHVFDAGLAGHNEQACKGIQSTHD